ncbi:MAG: site-2 protease family protein [Clostridiales bacterium]|nr:site-2 protease family protein [Clostridiales bacterium]
MLGILFDDSLSFFERIIIFVVLAVALLFSIILHEVAHGVVAHWNGDDTAKVNGRLSLNPAKHFDPLGAIMILFVGFGYARPVPVNPYNFRHYRKGCILVSIAGVTTNIIIAFLSSGLAVLMSGLYAKTNGAIGLFLLLMFFSYLSWFNIVLCFFNILPFFPLDGFNLIKALCKRENKFIRFMRSYGQYILIALILVELMVDRLGAPSYFSPLDLYFDYTAGFVDMGFTKFWHLIFGGI